MIQNIQNIHTPVVNTSSGSLVKPSGAMDFFYMEIWKDIEGFEGLYQVSNLGNVKSLPRAHNLSKDFIIPERVLAKKKHYNGYVLTCLCKGGKHKYTSVHGLVAKAFIPNPENKPQVNHINGIKDDNRVENLEWNTSRENLLHAFSIGTKVGAKGEGCSNSKLKNGQVLLIKQLLKEGVSNSEIARRIGGINKVTVSMIKRGITWKHINL